MFLSALLKITFHLQLLQNTGYIPHVVEYIFVTISQPIVFDGFSETYEGRRDLLPSLGTLERNFFRLYL